jgi:hypothetical protein
MKLMGYSKKLFIVFVLVSALFLGLFSCEEGGSTSGSKYPPEIQSKLGYYIIESENSANLLFFRSIGDDLYLLNGDVQKSKVNMSQITAFKYSKVKTFTIANGKIDFRFDYIDGFVRHIDGQIFEFELSWYSKVSLSSFKEKIATYISAEDIAKIFFI